MDFLVHDRGDKNSQSEISRASERNRAWPSSTVAGNNDICKYTEQFRHVDRKIFLFAASDYHSRAGLRSCISLVSDMLA